jgi:hypothetical protein
MKRYEGKREGHAAVVTVDGQPLNPRLDVWNHSPSGMEWSYAGSGPAQLALAILLDCLGDKRRAVFLHHGFKHAVVSTLPFAGWTLTEGEIRTTVAELETHYPED